MATEQYVWRVYSLVRNQYESIISQNEPLVAADSTSIDQSLTTIIQSLFLNLVTDGYLNLESQLADNLALRIQASDANGGISMTSGFGGTIISSTNAISIDGGAASNFTVSNGNLTLNSTTGLVNIDAQAGINIGNGSTTPILIGTSGSVKNVELGSSIGTSSTAIHGGTYGLTIGNDANPGGIYIASINTDKTVTIGNSSTFTRIHLRYGEGGGLIKKQSPAVFISDADTNILTAHLLNGILAGTLTTTRQLLLPTAATLVASIPGVEVNDCFDFSVINRSNVGGFTIVPDTGGSVDGNNFVDAVIDKSSQFRLCVTNIGAGTETYVIYRMS